MKRMILTAILSAPLLGHAAGPFFVDGNTPVRYSNSTVTMNFDVGTLGTRTNAEADDLVLQAFNYWNAVTTATINLTQGNDLSNDIDVSNYQNLVTPLSGGSTTHSSLTDNLNPVIYDNDGQIIDDFFGTGQSNSIGGIATSIFINGSSSFISGYIILNGKMSLSDAVLKNVIAHEMGHMIGLDHSQVDRAVSCSSPSNLYPLMYPVANCRQSTSLHVDDIASVSGLYPASNVTTEFGEITGTFVDNSGNPIPGGNIWVQNSLTNDTYSVVSDYLMQGTGNFRLLLPTGMYSLHATAINASFTGPSSVGPFTKTAAPNQGIPTVDFNTNELLDVTAGKATNVMFVSDGTGSSTLDNVVTTGGGSTSSSGGGGGGSGGTGPLTLGLLTLIVMIGRRMSTLTALKTNLKRPPGIKPANSNN